MDNGGPRWFKHRYENSDEWQMLGKTGIVETNHSMTRKITWLTRAGLYLMGHLESRYCV